MCVLVVKVNRFVSVNMPVFVENPAEFSKRRLKSELISHSVALPPVESDKQVYLEVYMKHVGNKNNADFSSDEEEQVQHGNEETKRGHNLDKDSNMVDLSSLTDDQLKLKLLQYGVKAGPIVGSTRALYERKLSRMMTHYSQHHVHRNAAAEKYSDSEEDREEESESEQLGQESVNHTDHYVNTSKIENRLSPQSKSAEHEKSCSQSPVTNRAYCVSNPHHCQLNKSTKDVSLYLTPEYLTPQKQTTTIKPSSEAVTDVLREMFPDTAVTPTGITATKRRSIKGAAGRPVQFKYPETPLSPATLEKREIQQCLVPLWVQIVVFLLVVALLCLIYLLMDEQLENPFSPLLQGNSQEPSSSNLGMASQDTHT